MKKEKVDFIIHNAKVYTVDNEFSIVEAFAVKDKRIVQTGSSESILDNFDSEVFIDLQKQPVYPGFIDAHCHFTGYGLNKLLYAELYGTSSFSEILRILIDHNNLSKTDWLLGRGWDQNDWQENQFPDNSELNELFPDKPVLLLRIDGHAALANNYALNMAGIIGDTEIDGGKVILLNGKPSGLLIDNAIELVRKLVPQPNHQYISDAILKAQKDCHEYGLTTIADAGLDKEVILIMDSLQNSHDLKMRVYAMLSPTNENIEYFVKNGPWLTDMLSVRSIKLFADGALGSRGAKLFEPYSDDLDNTGLIMESPDYYKDKCKLAFDNSYQVNTHAIGDSAVSLMLNIYSEFLKGKNDKRWRIEHSQIVSKKDISLFGQNSIIPSIQATHATSDMYWAEERLGPDRVKNAYPYKNLLDQNGWLPNGTDFPVEEINPIYTFFASVFRKDKSLFPDNGFQIENALSREETIKSMTIWAAKSCFMENNVGSIEKGKFADFIILDKDIFMALEKDIPNVRVLETWISGEKVYSKQ